MKDEPVNSPTPITSHLAEVSYKLGLLSLLSLSVEIAFFWAWWEAYDLAGAIIPLAAMVTAFCTGLAAVVFALVAARRIKKSPTTFTGLDLAKNGFIGGSLGALVTIMMFLVFPPHTNRSRGWHPPRNACINNLRQIEGAKEQWALEQRKTQSDTPAMSDLVGTDKYIKVLPTCPANGSYFIGNMTERPECSIPDHTLP